MVPSRRDHGHEASRLGLNLSTKRTRKCEFLEGTSQEGNQWYFGVKAHIGVDYRLQRRRPARADRARHGLKGLSREGAAHAPEHLAVHRKRYAASARRRSRTTHPEVGRERRPGNREAKPAARRLKQDPSLRDGVPPQSTVGRFCIRGTGGGTSITRPQAPPRRRRYGKRCASQPFRAAQWRNTHRSPQTSRPRRGRAVRAIRARRRGANVRIACGPLRVQFRSDRPPAERIH